MGNCDNSKMPADIHGQSAEVVLMASIFKQLTDMAEEFCKNNCKWPVIYTPEYFNERDYMDRLLNEKCSKCPFRALVGGIDDD